MIVVCLEGCHGSGKTELCKRFRDAGYMVLDEAFLDMPEYALHPQSLLMETTWVCTWFSRLLQKAQEMKMIAGEQVFIADRSPYSAVFYAANGKLLAPVIREQMREVKAAANIEIFTVHVKVAEDVLWRRILDRLRREPGRAKYNEDKRSWMEKTLAFYDNFSWDLRVENNEDPIEKVHEQLVSVMCRASPRFQSSVSSGWHLERHVVEQREQLSQRRPRSGSLSCASPGPTPRSRPAAVAAAVAAEGGVAPCAQLRGAPKPATPIVSSSVHVPSLEDSPPSGEPVAAPGSIPTTPHQRPAERQSRGTGAPATAPRRASRLASRPRPEDDRDEEDLAREGRPAEKRGREAIARAARGEGAAGGATGALPRLRPALGATQPPLAINEEAEADGARQVKKCLSSAFEPITEEA